MVFQGWLPNTFLEGGFRGETMLWLPGIILTVMHENDNDDEVDGLGRKKRRNVSLS